MQVTLTGKTNSRYTDIGSSNTNRPMYVGITLILTISLIVK